MHLALDEALKALKNDEVPIGAVIVNPRNGKVLASGYNLVETLHDPTAHAELLVIRSCCKDLQSKILSGYDIYVTLEPCAMCMQAIFYAKINRVYFAAYSNIEQNNFSSNHNTEIYGGICEEQSKNILNNFFKTKRI